jgi:hypothetical protein
LRPENAALHSERIRPLAVTGMTRSKALTIPQIRQIVICITPQA